MMGTISYSDESIKAISTIEMYSSIFGVYKTVFESETTVNMGAKFFTTTCVVRLDAMPVGCKTTKSARSIHSE